MVVVFSKLPSVDLLLSHNLLANALKSFGHKATVEAIRSVIDNERSVIKAGRPARDTALLAGLVLARLESESISKLRPVYNLTGTILHTNLGRAILSDAAIAAASDAMRHPVALEYNLKSGSRGERDDHLRQLICELTGAEDATLVNNNAAAVFITLNMLGELKSGRRQVILSRGELVEIGGAFRMPDIMEKAGVTLREIGTTNRTHRADYINAISEETAAIAKVHTSNFVIQGFSKSVSTQEVANIAHDAGLPLYEDLGSGNIIDLRQFGLQAEPCIRKVVEAGADLVSFSGDKLLGGPQAGFIVGKAELIARINRNPLKRILRMDKIRLAALEATLHCYKNESLMLKNIPTLRFLARKRQDIAEMAGLLLPDIQNSLGDFFNAEILPCESEVGSGASPAQTLPSIAIAIKSTGNETLSLNQLAQKLRELPVPVIGRMKANRLMLDLRTLEEPQAFAANFGLLDL
ncbi:L-seryl-tRNA(Sec) selenium transferase [Bartonella sp. HY406]|nr:L-seryl-tRNA(Sec) selenium transferase [Bartonella sp. HY406]